MKHEILNENCKILWIEDFDYTNKKYTQVSGYVFNDKNELLIVKNNDIWTIPGGHIRKEETPLDTLIREIREEANVEVSNIKYLGAVEVIEGKNIYYQLRFTAKASKINSFKKFETIERKFVKLKDLNKYITWSEE